MEDEKKTKKQLITELGELRQSVAKLKGFEEQFHQAKVDQDKFTKAFLQNSIPISIATLKEGRIIEVSDAFLNAIGRKRDEVIGHTSIELGLLTEEDRTYALHELSKSGRIENMEKEINIPGRGRRYVIFNTVIISLDNEDFSLTTGQDVSERKQLENALRDSEEKFRLLFNSGNDFMAVHLTGKDSMPTKFVQVNDAACELLGYTREEMLQLSPQDIDKANSLGLVPAIIEKFIKDKHVLFETEVIAKNGKSVPMEVSLTLFQLQDSEATLCVARNITERKLAGEILAKSQEKYRLITENLIDHVCLVDMNFVFQYVTNCKEIVGYELEEMVGISGFSITHPDDLALVTGIFKEGIENVWHEISFETRLRHKDGHYVLLAIRARKISDSYGKIVGAVLVGYDTTQHREPEKMPPAVLNAFTERRLSPREKEILGWVMQGKSTWDISTILKISERTVKFHIDNAMKKLSALNRAHAVAIAMENELINK